MAIYNSTRRRPRSAEATVTNPRVFMSHATEDKERFVVPFATVLRQRGLDVWLDQWEMLPGDSLVQRIFTEGIDEATAIIVVMSATSVTKRWVAEELDAAVVKRIQEDSLLIPIVLDGLAPKEIPAAIRHLLYEPVPDVNDFETAADRILRSVLNQRDKPDLGALPAYAASGDIIRVVDGLDRIDSLVLKLAGEEAVRDFGTRFSTQDFLDTTMNELGITDEQCIESLEVLDADGYIELHRTLGSGLSSMSSFTLETAGLQEYASTFIDEYTAIQHRVVTELVGGPEQGDDQDIASKSAAPRLLVLHIMKLLDMQGLLRLSESMGPTTHYFNVSPKLRRLLD